ncbi:MAG: HemK/PrmC family methyltransferase, partial [Rhodanobacteraceae bacterium]
SGAVALAIASERRRAEVTATDASEDALAVARANAERLGLDTLVFVQGDWWQPLAGRRFDIIVSNPPYIAADDHHLGQGDLRLEPLVALASGSDGLDAIRQIVAGAAAHLDAGGWLLLEHGWNQGAAVRALLEQAGFDQIFSARDLQQHERVSGGRKPQSDQVVAR